MPLSPYLSIIITSVLFQRIHIRDKTKTIDKRTKNANFNEVLYADDTILASTTGAALTKYLHLIEEESGKIGLKLNYGTCKLLTTNPRMQVKIKSGTKMQPVNEA